MSLLGRLFGRSESDPARRTSDSRPTQPIHADPGQTLSLQAFAERYADAVRLAFPGQPVNVHHFATPEATYVEWRMDDGSTTQTFFGNAYSRYVQHPGSLDTLLQEHLRSAIAGRMPNSHGALKSLLPTLKSRAWMQAGMAQLEAASGKPQEFPVLTSPSAGDLLVAYVEDTAQSMRFISPSELEEMGMTQAELHQAAIENLQQKFLSSLRIEGGNGRFVARLDGIYDATMALVFGSWRNRVNITGDVVLVVRI
jgi:hypothetical protein